MLRANTYFSSGTGPPYRRILDSGIRAAAGGDGMQIAPMNPFIHMYHATTGRNARGTLGNDGQQISRLEALRLYTSATPWFFDDEPLGTIEVGNYGDLVVLNDDKERAPQVFDVMRRLPPTDVEAGAILWFNLFTNSVRDPVMYIDAVEPKIFVPLHHDFRFVTPESSGDDWKAAMEREMVVLPESKRPELRWLYDPFDYLRPGLLTFDIKAPYWATGGSSARPSGTCKRAR